MSEKFTAADYKKILNDLAPNDDWMRSVDDGTLSNLEFLLKRLIKDKNTQERFMSFIDCYKNDKYKECYDCLLAINSTSPQGGLSRSYKVFIDAFVNHVSDDKLYKILLQAEGTLDNCELLISMYPAFVGKTNCSRAKEMLKECLEAHLSDPYPDNLHKKIEEALAVLNREKVDEPTMKNNGRNDMYIIDINGDDDSREKQLFGYSRGWQ